MSDSAESIAALTRARAALDGNAEEGTSVSEKTRCGTCDQYVPCPCHEKQAPPPPAPSARAEVAEVAALEGEGVQRRLAAALAATASAPPAPAPVRPVAGEEVEVGSLKRGTLVEVSGKTWVVSSHGTVSAGTYLDPVNHEAETDWVASGTLVRVVSLAPLAATGDREQGGKDATERECEVEDKWQAEIDAHAKTRKELAITEEALSLAVGDRERLEQEAAALRADVARLEGEAKAKSDRFVTHLEHIHDALDEAGAAKWEQRDPLSSLGRIRALAADRDTQRAGRERAEADLNQQASHAAKQIVTLTADLATARADNEAAIRSRADYVDSIREAAGCDGEDGAVEVIGRIRAERDSARHMIYHLEASRNKHMDALKSENAREREAADRNLKRAEEAERDSTTWGNRCEQLSELVTATERERDDAVRGREAMAGSLETRVAALESLVKGGKS